MKVERTVKLDPDAAELLIQLAGSSRKQGEFLSTLIREKARERAVTDRLRMLEEQLGELRTTLMRLEQGLDGRHDGRGRRNGHASPAPPVPNHETAPSS